MNPETHNPFFSKKAIAKIAVALRQRKADGEQLFKSLEPLESAAKDDIRSCLLLTQVRRWLQDAYHSERRALETLCSFGKRL